MRRPHPKRIVAALAILAGFWFLNYNSAVGRWTAAVDQCKTSSQLVTLKNANGWRAQRNYIMRVLQAASVKGDVKAAARHAVITFDDTVASLDRYLAIPCEKRTRKPSILTGR